MFKKATNNAIKTIETSIKQTKVSLKSKEVSSIMSLTGGTAVLSGLSNVEMNELIEFDGDVFAMVQTLNPDNVGVVFLNSPNSLKAGDQGVRTHRVVDVPVGDELLGRIINPLGQVLDGGKPIVVKKTLPIERPAAPIMDRAPVDTPLQTGIKAIDSFSPIGRGQRELILGDRQTGKTAIAIDTILNQKGNGVICIYCAIGQREAGIARIVSELKKQNILSQCIIVCANGEDEAGMQYIAPYSATSIGEYFMEQGKDVLIIYDDLTNHARAYRQMSLLLKRPPGREAFPGDVFYIHSRLLERSTKLCARLGGGSLTALPIVSTEAGNLSAYIPTNIISITDGQIYLSTSLFQKGLLPAIETGRSVSRVGGDAQLPAYSKLIGPLKLFYNQFEELESFSKFGTAMDEKTLEKLNRGRAIRMLMTQRQYQPMNVVDQIAVILAANHGLFDTFIPEQITKGQEIISQILHSQFKNIITKILNREKLSEEMIEQMIHEFTIGLKGIKK